MNIIILQLLMIKLHGNVKFIMIIDSIKKTDEVKENAVLNKED